MTDPRPRDNGTSRMTEFPALRDALVRAAVRRRRRRRAAAGTAVPLFAAGAAAVAALAFSPAPPPDRERTVAPPGPTSTATSTPKPYAQQSLQEAFAVFRRKPARADRLPAGVGIAGVRQLDEVRFLKQGGPKRYFAVSYATKDGESVCILQVRHKRFDSATCAPAVEAIDEATPLYTGVAGDIGVFLPDSSRDLRFLLANGTGGVSSSNNLSLVKVFTPLAGMSWTGGSGTRHIKDFGTKRGARHAPDDLPEAPARATAPGRARPCPPEGADRRRPLLRAGGDRHRGDGRAGGDDPVLGGGHGALDRGDVAARAAGRRRAGRGPAPTRHAGRLHARPVPAALRPRPGARSATRACGGR